MESGDDFVAAVGRTDLIGKRNYLKNSCVNSEFLKSQVYNRKAIKNKWVADLEQMRCLVLL